MATYDSQQIIPVTRVAMLQRYMRLLIQMGAPVPRLLALSKIPAELIEHPAAVVPLQNAFRFCELACKSLGTEHLGLYIGLSSQLEDLGPYGSMLQNSLTVYDYLWRGISLYSMLLTGQRFWLSKHEEEFRFNIETIGDHGIGAYQSHVESLCITIARLRQAAGPDWSPREISFAYRSREDLPAMDLFAGSRILRGTGKTYFTIPPELMQMRFPRNREDIPVRRPEFSARDPLPENLSGLVQLQIENLLSERAFQIDTVAESLSLSRRSLQRRLALQGLSYSRALTEVRMRLAADWLENSHKPVTEIAFDLGYKDASNFTRAFRRRAGVSPQTYRDMARRS